MPAPSSKDFYIAASITTLFPVRGNFKHCNWLCCGYIKPRANIPAVRNTQNYWGTSVYRTALHNSIVNSQLQSEANIRNYYTQQQAYAAMYNISAPVLYNH